MAAWQRPMADLMMDFESIGVGCEFGVVQRCCGAEPLGMLRFTGSFVENLVRLLESGLADFFTPDDLGIDVHGEEREYMVFSRRYADFRSHTNAFVGRDEEAVILAREIKKVAYLKRRFETDWRDAARIYVHVGCEDEAAILELHAALRARSDCVLLWVVPARSPEERGRVEVRAPGLLRGHIAHYGTFDGGPRLDLPGWAMVCRAAEAIVKEQPLPPPPSPRPMVAGFAWSPAPCGSLEMGSSIGRYSVFHATAHSVAIGKLRLTASIPAKSPVVFSVWVRLGEEFRGRRMVLTVHDATLVNHRRADLATRSWQQMWVVARVAEPREALHFSFDVDALRGSNFQFAGWQLEEGGIPDEGLRPADDVSFEQTTEATPTLSHRIRRWIAKALTEAAGRVEASPADHKLIPSESLTADAILHTADTFLRAGLFEEADGLLRAGMFLFPLRAELFTHYALCAQRRGDLTGAVHRWGEVVDLFPQFALGHYRLAQCLRESGEIDRALAVIERVLSGHSDDVGMVSEAARVLAAAQHWPEAVVQWDRAIAMDGGRPEWRTSRGVAARAAAFLSQDGTTPVPSG